MTVLERILQLRKESGQIIGYPKNLVLLKLQFHHGLRKIYVRMK